MGIEVSLGKFHVIREGGIEKPSPGAGDFEGSQGSGHTLNEGGKLFWEQFDQVGDQRCWNKEHNGKLDKIGAH